MAPTEICRYFAMGSCTNGNSCTFLHSKVDLVCEFYLAGNCKFGQYCQMKHSKPTKSTTKTLQQPAPKPTGGWSERKQVKYDKKRQLCSFHVSGNCNARENCRFLHGLECPNCHKNCIDPITNTHQEECIGSSQEREEHECAVCLESVKDKKDPRFGLMNCEHAVCLQCLRQWRQVSVDVSKACPLCRVVTHHVTPSLYWPSTVDEKTHLIETYKLKLSTIDCKHFNKGRGTCPFGNSCFYKHVDVFGVDQKSNVRILSNSEFDESGLSVMKNVSLFDFIQDSIN